MFFVDQGVSGSLTQRPWMRRRTGRTRVTRSADIGVPAVLRYCQRSAAERW